MPIAAAKPSLKSKETAKATHVKVVALTSAKMERSRHEKVNIILYIKSKVGNKTTQIHYLEMK